MAGFRLKQTFAKYRYVVGIRFRKSSTLRGATSLQPIALPRSGYCYVLRKVLMRLSLSPVTRVLFLKAIACFAPLLVLLQISLGHGSSLIANLTFDYSPFDDDPRLLSEILLAAMVVGIFAFSLSAARRALFLKALVAFAVLLILSPILLVFSSRLISDLVYLYILFLYGGGITLSIEIFLAAMVVGIFAFKNTNEKATKISVILAAFSIICLVATDIAVWYLRQFACSGGEELIPFMSQIAWLTGGVLLAGAAITGGMALWGKNKLRAALAAAQVVASAFLFIVSQAIQSSARYMC